MNIHRVDNLSFYLDQSIVLAVVQVSNYALTVLDLPWDPGDLDYLYHPSFQLHPRVPVVRWGLWGLWLQEDLHHPCTHVDPWGLEVHNFQVIPQHQVDPRVPGFLGLRESQEHNSQSLHKSNLLV